MMTFSTTIFRTLSLCHVHVRARCFCGRSNFYHKADVLAYALQASHPSISAEVECRRRVNKGEAPIQSVYFSDIVDCVGPITQTLSWVWQDTNRAGAVAASE